MATRRGALHALAASALTDYGPFTPAERRVFEAAEAGRVARAAGTSTELDPDRPERWGDERLVRPDVLRWLCTDREAVRRVRPEGVRIHGARFDSPLDLSHAVIPFPLVLARCAVQPGLILNDADIPLLLLSACRVGPVRCDRLTVHGPVSLAEGTRVLGGVRLTGATILGDLSLRGARLINGGAVALAAMGLCVEGNLHLDGGFRALGAVRLIDATVSGHLNCQGGRFLNRGGVALACDRMQVGGSTYLDAGFKAYGQVRLAGARVMGATHGEAGEAPGRRRRPWVPRPGPMPEPPRRPVGGLS